MTNMLRSQHLNKRSRPITETNNDATHLCLAPLTNADHVTQVFKLPNARVTGDFSSGCILPSEREKSRRPFQIRKQFKSLRAFAAFDRPSVDAVVLDGAAIVNMLPPGQFKTFKEYVETAFFIINYRALNVKRIDWVWDRYGLENSLKQGAREVRGTGTRRRVHVQQSSSFFKLEVISEAG